MFEYTCKDCFYAIAVEKGTFKMKCGYHNLFEIKPMTSICRFFELDKEVKQ